MLQRILLAIVVLGIPSLSRAQEGGARALPPGSQLYLRWDGLASHREAFDKTAVGKMLAGDTGKFLGGLVEFIEKQVDNLAGQAPPEVVEIAKAVPTILRGIGKHGFRVGVEIHKVSPPEIEGVLVFPKGGKDEAGLLPLLKKLAAMAGAEVKEEKVDGRNVTHIPSEHVHVGWWKEGDDAVIVIGTEGPHKAAKRVGSKGKHLAGNPLYKELQSFKEFPTWADGYLDFAKLFKVSEGFGEEAGKLIEDLGLNGLKSVTFHSGFDGPAERSVILVDMPGPRKGLLKLANRRPIKLADLPPMPSDLTSFSASNLDLAALYEAIIGGIEAGVKIYLPNQADQVKGAIKLLEENILGVKLKEELFDSFGDLVVSYSSPSEGPLGFGAVYLVKVKDAKKLQGALDTLFNKLANFGFIPIELKKKSYRDAELQEIHIGGGGGNFQFAGPGFQLPTFVIHNGWLGFSSYPQPLKGFVLRTKGELANWKPSANLTKRLAGFPKEFVSIAVSDPRPSLKFLFSIAPTGVALINSLTARFAPGAQFDVSLLPNALEATRHLFPNITVGTDDGKKWRIETWASLMLPF
jgi:hypothetical protein